jgi:hypothetical protein
MAKKKSFANVKFVRSQITKVDGIAGYFDIFVI